MDEKLQTILFRIDFRNKGDGLVEWKDYAYTISEKKAKDLFSNRPELQGYFESHYLFYDITPDAQWISKHPEEYQLYLDQFELRKAKELQKREKEKKRIENAIISENEQEVQDRVICPRCGSKLQKDTGFCMDCGYPSEEMHKKQSWLSRGLYFEGVKAINKE